MTVERLKEERMLLEGSQAVAESVARCRPNVIAAYPITPQTHIVAELAQKVANGELESEYINVESEHSAASACLGAAAVGARAFTATASQGFLLMLEVLYNIASMRMPMVLTNANRSVSAPINIWNDMQDSVAARDTGWIQLYAENNQEVADLHIQAYRIAEDHRVMLPVMVCMDGFTLTHAYEPVSIPTQEAVDEFLPPFEPLVWLTPKDPIALGTLATPEHYMETRYAIQQALERALSVIQEVAQDYRARFGRGSGGLIEEYQSQDAETVIVSMGTVAGTIKDAVDEMRAEGRRVGLVKVTTYRPFPAEAFWRALKDAKRVAVIEKDISLGFTGTVASELRAAFYGRGGPAIGGYVVGLGGRDVSLDTIKEIVGKMESGEAPQVEFVDLKLENLEVVE